jgi:hypothetical protein
MDTKTACWLRFNNLVKEIADPKKSPAALSGCTMVDILFHDAMQKDEGQESQPEALFLENT